MEKKNNINVMIRINKNKIEQLKNIARKKSYEEKIYITHNDLIVAAVLKEYKEYFNEKK